jgi:hypothetical protein
MNVAHKITLEPTFMTPVMQSVQSAATPQYKLVRPAPLLQRQIAIAQVT